MINVGISPEYFAWRNAKARCNRKNHPDYHRYGQRGIKMCLRWASSFKTFLSDMGPRPSKLHSLDRIDNNGNYEPSNCRWALKKEQQNNMRSNVIVDYEGQKLTLKQLCDNLKKNYHQVYQRHVCLKWSIHKSLNEPYNQMFDPLKNKR